MKNVIYNIFWSTIWVGTGMLSSVAFYVLYRLK